MATYNIKVTGVWQYYRAGAGLKHATKGKIYGKDNKTYSATKREWADGIYWYYIPSINGWMSSKFSSVSEVKDPPKKTETALKTDEKKASETKAPVLDTVKPVNPGNGLDAFEMGKLGVLGPAYLARLRATNKIYGQPFQFDESVDLRVINKSDDKSTTGIGTRYAETFIGEAPIVSILPGRTNFLPGVSKKNRKAFETTLLEKVKGHAQDWVVKDVLDAEVRYFDFTSDFTTYMNYVNLMCRASAIYMGMGDEKVVKYGKRQKLKFFDWSNYHFEAILTESERKKLEAEKEEVDGIDSDKDLIVKKDDKGVVKKGLENVNKGLGIFKKLVDIKDIDSDNLLMDALFGQLNFIQFYVDPATSFQESNSNHTTQSMLAGYMSQASTMAKEIRFVANASGSTSALMSNPVTRNMVELGKTTSGLLGGAVNMIVKAITLGSVDIGKTRLFNAAKIMTAGGNMILPDIYQSSDYQKSYNISINLTIPYATKLAYYLHILVPLFHLMAFSFPRQVSANGYAHPFLVRMSSKGWFNCEMGMVDNISIEKVPGSFSIHGFPTEVRVQLSVRDLYSNLMITPTTRPDLFLNNTGLTNWLTVTSGVDITVPSFKERWLNIVMFLTAGAVMDIPANITKGMLEDLRNTTGLFIDNR